MSDPLRTDPARAVEGATGADRDAKLEQLLLLGLDHYFSAEYEQAVNVWSRALFLDRSNARARAYIERARSALSEKLRQSEELLHDGVAAFNRGEGGEARRLLEAAMHQGAPRDQALALLDRLDRLERGGAPDVNGPVPRAGATVGEPAVRDHPARTRRIAAGVAIAVLLLAGAAIVAVPRLNEWRGILAPPPSDPPAVTLPSAGERTLPIPRRGETALARAQALAARGHLHDALTVLDGVRITDPQRPDADRLRTDIQRQLLAISGSQP
jgi:tetratricopeptide (TPR) repeat protein